MSNLKKSLVAISAFAVAGIACFTAFLVKKEGKWQDKSLEYFPNETT